MVIFMKTFLKLLFFILKSKCFSTETIFDDLDFGQAKAGYCDEHCKTFVIFIVIFSFVAFMHSTSEVGSILVIMRCTDPKGK